MLINRTQESLQIQEHGGNQWENGGRMVKTSEDHYERSDSSSSHSSDAPEIYLKKQMLIILLL